MGCASSKTYVPEDEDSNADRLRVFQRTSLLNSLLGDERDVKEYSRIAP